MTKLSNQDAIRALLTDVEQAVIALDRSRSQEALHSYQAARDELLTAIETVRVGGRLAE